MEMGRFQLEQEDKSMRREERVDTDELGDDRWSFIDIMKTRQRSQRREGWNRMAMWFILLVCHVRLSEDD